MSMKRMSLLLAVLLLICAAAPALAKGNEELIGNWLLKDMTGFEGDAGAQAMRELLDSGAVVVYTFDKRGGLFQRQYVNDVVTRYQDYYYMDEVGIFVRSGNASVPFKVEDDVLTLYQEKGEVTFVRVEPEDLPFIINANEDTLWGKWKLMNASGEGAESIVESIMDGTEYVYIFYDGKLAQTIVKGGEESNYLMGQYSVTDNTIFLEGSYFAYFSIQNDNTLYLYNDATRMMLSRIG